MSDIKKCSCGSEDHTVEGLLSDSEFEIVRLDKEISSLESQLAAKAAEVERLRKWISMNSIHSNECFRDTPDDCSCGRDEALAEKGPGE